MYSFFVGIDVSKATIDVSSGKDRNIEYLSSFTNDISGFKQMLKLLEGKTETTHSEWLICFENTGIYSKQLLEWLCSMDIPCKEENPLQISKSMGIRRGKNDQMDSKMICRYAYEKRDIIEASKLPKPFIVKLKKLLVRREMLIRQKVALDVSLKEQKNILDPVLLEFFTKQNDSLIAMYTAQIKQIDQAIQKVIDEDGPSKRNNELIQSIKGIGPVIAAYMIAITQNFTLFSNARQFACYAGIAPFPNQSGIRSGKKKINNMSNKKIKSLLSIGAITAACHDNQLKQYRQKKLAEGKYNLVVINNVKNKLVQRIFAVIKRQSPFVELIAYA